jgi:TolB-like protein
VRQLLTDPTTALRPTAAPLPGALRSTPEVNEKSIAVLAFANMSGNPENTKGGICRGRNP